MIIGADFTHMPLTNTDTNPFWEFSLAIYARPGVAAACLELQETRAVDVNVLLYVCWCAWEGRGLEASDVAAVDAAIAPWRRDVVLPIRVLRQGLRSYTEVESTRSLIKQAELEAERAQQQRMFVHSGQVAIGSKQDSLHHNLAQFAAFHGCDTAALHSFEQAVRTAFSCEKTDQLYD